MAFTTEIKGVTLTMNDMAMIHNYYEAACTAEYIMENYPNITNESDALELGYMVRHLMSKYDLSELDAIEHMRKKGVL